MPQIFLSYRRGPTGYVATLLAEELRARFGPDAVFMDVDSIPVGADFRDRLTAAVADCQVLLALIGDDWTTTRLADGLRRIEDPNDFVRVEIEAALERGIPVVPILTGGATVPLASELPEPLKPLAFRNAAELRSGPNLKGQMQSLMGQLSSILPAPASVEVHRQTSRPLTSAFRWSRRNWLIVFACFSSIVVVAAIVLFVHFRNKPPPPSSSGPGTVASAPPGNPAKPPPHHRRKKR
jgi:hypothetical protein